MHGKDATEKACCCSSTLVRRNRAQYLDAERIPSACHRVGVALSAQCTENLNPQSSGLSACRRRGCRKCKPQDKPWAHPDPPMAEGFGIGADSLREGWLRTDLLIIVFSIIVMIWAYRKFMKRDRNPFFHVAPTASENAQVSVEKSRTLKPLAWIGFGGNEICHRVKSKHTVCDFRGRKESLISRHHERSVPLYEAFTSALAGQETNR